MYWWMEQMYVNRPAWFGAVKDMDAPGAMSLVSNPADELVTVWATSSRLTTVTVAPGATVTVAGMNMKLEMAMAAAVAPVAEPDGVVGVAIDPPELHPAVTSKAPRARAPTALRRRHLMPGCSVVAGFICSRSGVVITLHSVLTTNRM